MKIIPVIDVMNGIAVHAVGGKRERYKPLRSVLCPDPNPVMISTRLKSEFGFSTLYMADLDAISGGDFHANLYAKVKELGVKLMLDAGLNVDEALKVADWVVIGTEVCPSLSFMRELSNEHGDRLVVSMDAVNGELLSPSKRISKMGIITMAKRLQSMGVTKVIFLDLGKVGTSSGVNLNLVRKLRKSLSAQLMVGGGVGGMSDVKELVKTGIDGVLIATALHRGTITPRDVQGFL
jgi:phosphoribosylformimino-5-aminoimidazole carboxamide ribotide isomerase